MSRRPDLIAFAILTLIFSYMLSIGATFNGILQPEMHMPTLGIIGLGLMGGLVLLLLKGHPFHRSAWNWVMVGWALAMGLSLVGNIDQIRRIGIAVWYITLYGVMWVLLTELVANKRLRRETLLDALLMAGVVILIFGYVQMGVALGQGGGIPRLVSTLGNPNALGAVLVVLAPVAFSRAWMTRQRLPRWILIGYGLLALILLALTGSRGAYLGAVAGLGTMALLLAMQTGLLGRWKTQSAQWRGAIIAAGGGALLMMLALAVFLLQSLSAPGRGADLRTFIYEAALRVFAEQPLTGSGLFTFGLKLMTVESSPPVQVHAHAHNVVLHIMAELGLPGLVMLVVTLGVGMWMTRRNWRGATGSMRLTLIAGVSAVVGFGVHHLLDLPAMMPAVALTGLIVWIVAVAPLESGAIERRWRVWVQAVGMLALWIALIGSGIWSSRLYNDYVTALRLAARTGDYRAAADALRPVISADPSLTLYPYQQGFLYGMAAAAGDGEAVQAGIAAYEAVLRLEPENVVSLINLSALYWQAGQVPEALAIIDRALIAAPESWQIALLRRRYALEQGNMAIAEAMTDRITELNPDALLLPEIGLTPDESVELSVPARFSLNLVAGDVEAAKVGWEAYDDGDRVRKLALSALLAMVESNDDASARFGAEIDRLARIPAEKAWVNVVQAQAALNRGGSTAARSALAAARATLHGGPLDADWALGINYGYAQFLRLMIERQFIPQVGYVDDDPVLLFWVDQIERGMS